MMDRLVRGTGLSRDSMFNPVEVELAPRQPVGFCCSKDHYFERVFALEAELPTLWECPKCGEDAQRADGTPPEIVPTRERRRHWDMLRERRTIAELEVLLEERLAELHATHL